MCIEFKRKRCNKIIYKKNLFIIKIMIDITDYIVTNDEAHTHVAQIGGDNLPINITNTGDLIEVLKDESRDYQLYEKMSDTFIPYVVFNNDSAIGARILTAIMKRLYNSHSPIVVLKCPDDYNDTIKNINKGDSLICAPYARVNADMSKEIIDTFGMIAKYRGLVYEPKNIEYLPLTWDITSYKEGNEIDNFAAFEDLPEINLSVMCTNVAVSNKVKMNAAQAKKAALIDSILMYTKEDIKSDKIKAKELIPLLNKNRSRDMSLFLVIGRCLYRIFHGESEGIELWRNACAPELQELCDEYWPTLETTGTYYTIYTLQHWASKDSPDLYKEWNSTSVRAAIEASVLATGGNLDVAQVAYRKNPTLFICDGDSPAECKFFRFNGTYYKECGIFDLQNYLDAEIVPEYEDFLKDLSKLADSNPENNFKEMMQKKIDRCIKILISLKTDAYQVSVIKILMRLYNRPGFDNIRDANPHLTVFEDCVFDGEQLRIRDGIPEDNATASTGYEFSDAWKLYSELGWEHEDVQCVLKNLKKIIYDDNKREVVIREFASRLHASNPYKRALLIYGPTNNAKSALTSWLGKALGPTYYPDVPNNMLYAEEAHPGNASPQMEMARFARVLPQMEITDTHILNEGLFKRFTGGNDKITYRGLYQKKIKSFVPTCVPMTVCNTYPRINGNSAALRTRKVVLKLDSKFITEKDPEYEQIKDMTDSERDKFMEENHWYWADTTFNNTIERTYKAFMWILIQELTKYRKKGENVAVAKLPRNIIEDTIAYFVKSNIYLQFIRVGTKKDLNSTCTTFTLYNAYKKWYTDNVSRFGYVSFGKFLEELESMGIKPVNDIFYHIAVTYQ